VVIRDINNVVVVNNVTDATGSLLLSTMKEGAYTVVVSSPSHQSYQSSLTVAATTTTTVSAFLSQTAVSYTWCARQLFSRAIVHAPTLRAGW
jgi:hypothetical protein